MNDEHMVEIESKITFLEDAVQELNQTAYQQQKQLERLEAICQALVKHVVELRDNMEDKPVANEKPPHY